ncbi:MAG: VWA domain-containing protein [Phycisphaerales bacterium]
MTFLTPIAGIAAGAVALPVLIAFYLLKLRRRPVRISSTMLWEGAVRDVQVNVPLRWVRASWMLLVHLLVLALFVLAIARPVIEAPGERTGRVILLIDRSASMNATDAGGSRLAAAKARAGEIVRELSSQRPEFTVVAYAADAVVLGRPADSPDEIARQLASIEPTDQPDDIERALTLVDSLARDVAVTDESAPAAPLVVLLTDAGRLADRPLALAGGDARFERVGPDPDADRRNTGIAAIAAERDADDPILARVFVRLVNASRDPVAVPVILSVDGSEVERTAVRLPGASGTELGELGRTFEARVPDAAVVEVRLDRVDALAADDRASVILPAARLPSVMLVAPGRRGRPHPDSFLLDVLNEMPSVSSAPSRPRRTPGSPARSPRSTWWCSTGCRRPCVRRSRR